MSAAERERLRRLNSGEASYRVGTVLKCAVCLALIGLLVMIGLGRGDATDVADRVTAGASAMVAP